jgi:hypothetical protein
MFDAIYITMVKATKKPPFLREVNSKKENTYIQQT